LFWTTLEDGEKWSKLKGFSKNLRLQTAAAATTSLCLCLACASFERIAKEKGQTKEREKVLQISLHCIKEAFFFIFSPFVIIK